MNVLDTRPRVHPKDREAWRRWLEANHARPLGVWLVTWKAATGKPRLEYDAAVEEALCFGWIDGQAASVDERRSKIYFAPRHPRSAWSPSNKERVARMLADGRMAPAGLAAVERAKANGMWSVLDSVGRLEVPPDLATALGARYRKRWDGLPVSPRRQLLAQIAWAKRDATRTKWVAAAVDAARSGVPRPSRELGSPRPRPGSRARSDRRDRPFRGRRRG